MRATTPTSCTGYPQSNLVLLFYTIILVSVTGAGSPAHPRVGHRDRYSASQANHVTAVERLTPDWLTSVYSGAFAGGNGPPDSPTANSSGVFGAVFVEVTRALDVLPQDTRLVILRCPHAGLRILLPGTVDLQAWAGVLRALRRVLLFLPVRLRYRGAHGAPPTGAMDDSPEHRLRDAAQRGLRLRDLDRPADGATRPTVLLPKLAGASRHEGAAELRDSGADAGGGAVPVERGHVAVGGGRRKGQGLSVPSNVV